MNLWRNSIRIAFVAIIVVAVAEISKRYPRMGALLLSLPVASILAITLGWIQHRDLAVISRLCRETLVLVPLGMPLFIPLAFAPRLGLDFWSALASGILLASFTTGVWLAWGPAL